MNRLSLLPSFAAALPCAAADMVALPGGSYTPFYAREQGKSVTVAPFRLDRLPVTNGEFATFVESHPEWGKTAVPRIFAEAGYLGHWREKTNPNQPVTNVSWFAASAYCRARGKALPSTDQWEYALADEGRGAEALRLKILAWYAVPNSELPEVGQAEPNNYGVAGLAGLVWEWTADYSAAMAGPELRNSGDRNSGAFCGGGSLGARDPGDYASFMRYSFRASLKASYVTANLGFRCASEIPQ